jgi:Zn-dependent peptidase ImmA (M78 family)/DNA-binding XRE family transcriptional regulator
MLGNKLRELRSKLNATQTDIGRILGIKQDIVSKIENNKRVLTSFEIFKLSKELDVPIGFFFGEVDLAEFQNIHFRATEELNEQDKKKIPLLKEIGNKQYDIEEVLKLRRDKILRKYPVEELDYIKIQEIALSERNALGFDEQEPIVDLLGLLRSKGIKILEPILELFEINGMFFTLDKDRFLIVINGDNSPAIKNFTVAHEFGHYLINRGNAFNEITKDIEETAGLSDREKIANAFAAEFLMPERSFDHFILTEETLALYMHNYRISRAAVVFRLRNLNKITEKDFQYYISREFSPIKALKKLEKLGIENEDVAYQQKRARIRNLSPSEKRNRRVLSPSKLMNNEYRTMVVTAYEKGLITYGKVADYLFLDEDELRKIVTEKEVEYEA